MSKVRPVEWVADAPPAQVPGHVRIIDQTLLPSKLVHTDVRDADQMWTAIRTLQIRGAPAIGIAAAMTVAVAAQNANASDRQSLIRCVERTAAHLATSRPTAVNLFTALDRMTACARRNATGSTADLVRILVAEACAIRDEDAAMCRAIGHHGVALLHGGDTVLTHCNAGALATAEFGTALAPIYTAHERGMNVHVLADETRPLLQGARLTAWELQQEGVDVSLISDNMAAHFMKLGRVQAVMVGADRIAANGDTANKIGTYGLAVLARAHDIPFYVLAPTTTIDLHTPTGRDIPIEERDGAEVTNFAGVRTAPAGVRALSPAFDVTPAQYITAIVCEHGIARPDYTVSLKSMRKA